ncbi:flavin reductase [Clostridium sp. Sa3CUN1]|uniref:Flavin reductase n=1 Tax=Clostridium gallinarum TaxID=2762246 RepID=A0ABR8Q1Y5_9CLOT|nr:flavin reductase [Clostridium gallinarum]MBD7914423.1 flavin reductase [Clostridium gallinarum]
MINYKEINPKELNENTFKLIGSDWMLITAAKDEAINTMTASWGGLGVLWNKNVAYIFIRPQRYTKEFVDASDKFSLTFFDESFKKDLSYLGTVSGRDEDKISKTKLNVSYIENIPVFNEAKLTILCRKLYAQDLDPNCFIDKDLADKCYPNKDYHTVYVAEIEKVLIKE